MNEEMEEEQLSRSLMMMLTKERVRVGDDMMGCGCLRLRGGRGRDTLSGAMLRAFQSQMRK